MKTEKKDEIITEVAKVSMQLHEAEDPERKLCTENGKVFAHQMQTSTSENRSESADVLFQKQNAEDIDVKPSRPPRWIERCKRWLVTYPIIIMILFCSTYMLSSTNAKLSDVYENKRYSDADTEIITELTTEQLTTKLESHGLEYVPDFYENCIMNYSRLHFDNGVDYALDFKFYSTKGYSVVIKLIFDSEYEIDNIDKYASPTAKHEITNKYERYEKRMAVRRSNETFLYFNTPKIRYFINFTDNKKTNTKIYDTINDTIICNIK